MAITDPAIPPTPPACATPPTPPAYETNSSTNQTSTPGICIVFSVFTGINHSPLVIIPGGSGHAGSSSGAAVGAVLGVLGVVMAITVVLVVTFLYWRKNRKYSFTNNNSGFENPIYGGDVY